MPFDFAPLNAGGYPVDPILSAVLDEFPDLRNWGVYNCRKIAGSSTWSQHSWGNAWDAAYPAGGSANGDPYLDDAVTWVRGERARGTWFGPPGARVQIGTVLWKVPDHFDHAHIETANKRTGTPPCADGTTPGGNVKDYITGQQENLNASGFTDSNGQALVVDGVYGPKTQSAELKRDKAAGTGGGSGNGLDRGDTVRLV